MLQHISQTRTMRTFTEGSMHFQQQSKQLKLLWKDHTITKRQLWDIRLLASQQDISIQSLNNQCFRQYGANLATMRRTDASRVIQTLKRPLKPLYKAHS
jgi:hypothetical protein